MLEAVVIRRQRTLDAPEPVDLGFLAEALLFYRKVHLIADLDTLQQIVPQIGAARILQLLDEQFLSISYVEKRTGVRTFDTGTAQQTIQPVTMWASDNQWKLDRVAESVFQRAQGGPGYLRQAARQFVQHVPTVDLSDEILRATRKDLVDQPFVQDAVRQVLSVLAPSYALPADYFFHVTPVADRFRVETNIDFQHANVAFNRRAQTTGETLSVSALLVYLLEARADLHFSVHDDADLATQAANALIIDSKFSELLSKAAQTDRKIIAFRELELSNGRDLGAALLGGEHTWDEFLSLLRHTHTREFKASLAQPALEAGVIEEYAQKLETDTWVGTLPVKSVRWMVMQGLETIAPPPLNLAISLFDEFFLDKLLTNRKLNQFVRGRLRQNRTDRDQ